jgi:hypothetical protein
MKTRHRWNKRKKWRPHRDGDRRSCLDCGLLASKARSAGWLLAVPGTTARDIWRRILPPCFGRGKAREAVSWGPEDWKNPFELKPPDVRK